MIKWSRSHDHDCRSVFYQKNCLLFLFSMCLLQRKQPNVFCKKGFLNNFTIFTGKHVWLEHTCFPVNIAKFWRAPILKNICKRLLLSPKRWLYCFLALYSCKLTKHSHFLIFITLHANSATKVKECGDILYNSNVTII